ncbi:hypothetical protein [Roseateles sp.]|uniref:hypothetical protein n=1 Tax=Roseateles sp. TaxID=1971397 RepID=UPI00326619D0
MPALAGAQGGGKCGGDIENALRQLDGKAEIEGIVVASDCKAWPPAGGKQTAAVMAFQRDGKSGRQRRWVIVLALLDSKTSRPLHSRRTELEEDATAAVGDLSLSLDTARYQVKPGTRALGLRFRSAARQPSGAESSWGDELLLFVPEGRQLRPVFGRTMSAQTVEVGSLSVQSTGAVWKNATMTLAVGPTGPPTAQGWNDLVITETLTRNGNAPAKFDSAPRRQQYVYHYDGKRYNLLADPAPFWDGYCCTVAW